MPKVTRRLWSAALLVSAIIYFCTILILVMLFTKLTF